MPRAEGFGMRCMTGHAFKPRMEQGRPFDTEEARRDAALVVESLAQGLCVCEADGRIALANEMFRSYSPAIRSRVAELCRRAASAFRADTPPGKMRQRLYRLHFSRKDLSFEVVVSPLGAEPGGRIVALVRDTTGHERIRRKVAAIDRAGAQLVRLEAEAIEKLHAAERLKLLESKIVQSAHDLLNFDHFSIRLLDERTGELKLVMSSGMPEKACAIRLYAQREGNGISGYVAATGEPYICPDTSKDPLYVFGLDQPGSSVTVPLRLYDRVIGVFNVESLRKGAFTQADRQFAQIFARYVAMALHILQLLVVERYTTSLKTTGTVQGELSEPLNDLAVECQALRESRLDPETAKHVERIMEDVQRIKRRISAVARGPQTILGVDDVEPPRDIDPVLEGRRVLVVDNEVDITDVIRAVLSKRGCHVTVCSDGASAMKLLKQWEVARDPDQGFDLVISDINLGDATGFDVFSAARSARGDVPVILMTGFGYDPHHSIVRASQEGLQCVLFKPFPVEKLVEETRRAVSRQPGGNPESI